MGMKTFKLQEMITVKSTPLLFPKLLSLDARCGRKFLVKIKQYQKQSEYYSRNQNSCFPPWKCSLAFSVKPLFILQIPLIFHLFRQIIPAFGFQCLQVWQEWGRFRCLSSPPVLRCCHFVTYQVHSDFPALNWINILLSHSFGA